MVPVVPVPAGSAVSAGLDLEPLDLVPMILVSAHDQRMGHRPIAGGLSELPAPGSPQLDQCVSVLRFPWAWVCMWVRVCACSVIFVVVVVVVVVVVCVCVCVCVRVLPISVRLRWTDCRLYTFG